MLRMKVRELYTTTGKTCRKKLPGERKETDEALACFALSLVVSKTSFKVSIALYPLTAHSVSLSGYLSALQAFCGWALADVQQRAGAQRDRRSRKTGSRSRQDQGRLDEQTLGQSSSSERQKERKRESKRERQNMYIT
jgi:hypothetical protein